MPRKKKNELKLHNRIKEITKEEGVTSILVGLWTDVHKTTISSWNSNLSQPTDENLDLVGELFEEDNRMLFAPTGRIKTGFAQALQAELDRLTKIEKIPIYIKIKESNSDKEIEVNNPVLVQALKDFALKYKQ